MLSLGLKYKYEFVSTSGFLLTMWLREVWIYKPLHTPLLCGRKAELKIGRFGGSEQPALCAVLKNTQEHWHCVCISFVSSINLNIKTVAVIVSCENYQIILYYSLCGFNYKSLSMHLCLNAQCVSLILFFNIPS